MDRNKAGPSNRGQKKNPSHFGGELFALGTKGSRDDTKNKNVPGSSSDRKRESTSSFAVASKRLRMSSTKESDTLVGSSVGHYDLWEQYAKDCDPSELISEAYAAIDQNDNESVIQLICSTLKYLTSSNIRSKVDPIPFLALAYLSKMTPSFFNNEIITGALLSTLRRDINIKVRYSSNIHIIATNLLTKGYMERTQWPEVFLRVYIEDALNERFWSDNEYCVPFISNICACFKTIIPPLHLLRSDLSGSSMSSGQTQRDAMNVDDDSGDNSAQGMDSVLPYSSHTDLDHAKSTLCEVQKRFPDSVVQKFIIEATRDQLNKRQQQDNYTKNFLKFLCSTSGIPEVRNLCISRLELWIHNGKLVKFAQQLLSYVFFNIKIKCAKDHEVLGVLLKIRLKTKPLINHYMLCLKEIIKIQPDILGVVLKLVVQNELSNTRNPNNMGMLATMFQTLPDQSAANLAEIYQEFLLQREDCLRTLRVFLRELVRILRFDVNIVKFCKVFLTLRSDLIPQIEQSEFRERIFHSIVDIICLGMLLTVTPSAREAYLILKTNRDVKNSQVLFKFHSHMSHIQLDVVTWMFETVPNVFKLQSPEYNQAMNKLLLLDTPDSYSRCDQWPSEPERAALLRMISETPIHEDTLIRIIIISLSKDVPFSVSDALEIILNIIKRVSTMKITNYPAVQANKFDLINFLFSMTEYRHPENITLPAHYEPPKLTISLYYWKAWIILVMISAQNPSTFGAFCWDHYPTMKMLIEMCITKQFNNSACTNEELQFAKVEKDHIIQYETYLAAQTSPQAVITEETAILVQQLMLMAPMGAARKVPNLVLEQLKYLNETYKLGHLFCRCRKPDLLLDIIQRQGTTQSMPWLSDLVQNSEGDLNHLPVQCLCEFLMFNAQTINEENSRDAELVAFLRNLIMDPNGNKHNVYDVLDYIFRRLSSTSKQSRTAALSGIKIIFKKNEEFQNEWLLKSIPEIPNFMEIRSFIIPQFRQALHVENSAELVMAYIQFIAAHTQNDSVNEMLDHVIELAQLIVERNTMFQNIVIFPDNCKSPNDENRVQTLQCLFVMFHNYIIKLQEYNEPYEWTDCPELIMVQFDDGVQLPLHVNVVHAIVILLTYSSKNMAESIPVLDYWFPPGRPAPIAFIPNLPQERIILLPDWLKLKMIRSPVDRLIEAAIRELTPDQIVLFVQNFGTPVNSMSKLLALLDTAVLDQFDAVKNAILNKAYLAQLIEIQQSRGAKNGHYVVQALELHSHPQTIPNYPKLNVNILETTEIGDYEPIIEECTSATVPTKNEVERVTQILLKSPVLNVYENYQHRQLLHQLMKSKAILKDDNLIKCFLRTIDYFIGSRSCKDVIPKNRHTYTLFRTFFNASSNFVSHESINKLSSYILSYGKEPSASIYTESLMLIIKNLNQLQQSDTMKQKSDELTKKNIIKNMLLEFNDNSNKNDDNLDNTIEDKSYDIATERRLICHNGLFIDWLIEQDPEIITSNILNKSLLFSSNRSEFRFYLLSLLNHETNWETIMLVADFLFRNSQKHSDYSTVLNFFEALTNNPKLWKGRDKSVSKSNQPNTVFLLNNDEVEPFAEFILREGVSEIESTTTNYDYKLCSRLNLFFRVTKKDKNTMIKFVEYVQNSSCPDILKLQVLQQLYIMYPSIKFLKLNNAGEEIYKLQTLKGCQADKVSNYLITCLGSLQTKKDFETLSSDTELLIRKLAASHPTLFLRQLSVLSSLIQGRAQNTIQSLREEFHFHRFVQILRCLELLQPMVFDDTFKNEFQATLTSYFKFFKHHSSVKEAYHILVKLVQLLQSYINVNPSSALLFVEQYVGILTELAAKYTSIAQLHSLVQAIALLQHKSEGLTELDDDETRHEFDLEESTTEVKISKTPTNSEVEQTDSNSNSSQLDVTGKGTLSYVMSGQNNKSGTSTISPHFLQMIKIIKMSNVEDVILGPLQEIECFTSKKFLFLHELFDRLLDLIFSPSAQIRSIAFIILIRHLKHNPGHAGINKCTLNAYIQCLRDDNPSVAATAIDNLCEITLLLQEYAVEILSVAFSLGIRSRLNTGTQIKRVLQTIMLQHGY